MVLAASGSAHCGGGRASAAGCMPDLPADSADADADGASAWGSVPRCGDGIIQLGLGEQCDPGDLAPDAAMARARRMQDDVRLATRGLRLVGQQPLLHPRPRTRRRRSTSRPRATARGAPTS